MTCTGVMTNKHSRCNKTNFIAGNSGSGPVGLLGSWSNKSGLQSRAGPCLKRPSTGLGVAYPNDRVNKYAIHIYNIHKYSGRVGGQVKMVPLL